MYSWTWLLSWMRPNQQANYPRYNYPQQEACKNSACHWLTTDWQDSPLWQIAFQKFVFGPPRIDFQGTIGKSITNPRFYHRWFKVRMRRIKKKMVFRRSVSSLNLARSVFVTAYQSVEHLLRIDWGWQLNARPISRQGWFAWRRQQAELYFGQLLSLRRLG